jgi:hypothetical protein
MVRTPRCGMCDRATCPPTCSAGHPSVVACLSLEIRGTSQALERSSKSSGLRYSAGLAFTTVPELIRPLAESRCIVGGVRIGCNVARVTRLYSTGLRAAE